MASTDVASVAPMSALLRERTRAAHEDAESSPFVRELLEGQRTREDYVALVGQQYYIYQALEAVGELLREDPVVGAFVMPQLTRLPAIEADLDFLDPGWRDRLEPLAATRSYVARIHRTATWPGGYIAHHYTRYLGDLSGGQVIRTLLSRQFGFDTNGVGFYIFQDIAKPKLFKDRYREQLDAIDWDEAERERVLAEANEAFRCNEAVFVELAEVTRRASRVPPARCAGPATVREAPERSADLE